MGTINLGAIIVDALRIDFIEASFKTIGHKAFLLDLGCGTRPYQKIYAHYTDKAIGADVACSPHGLAKVDIVLDGKTLPFSDNTFDIVLCSEVMEHVPDPGQFLREVHRVLAPKGFLILTTPFLVPIHEGPHDYYRYTIYGLQHLLSEAFFKMIESRPFSELSGVLISFFVQAQLKFWHAVAKIVRFRDLSSLYNPFVLLFVWLPQSAYVKFLKLAASIPRLRGLIEKLSYTTKGYGVLAIKQ